MNTWAILLLCLAALILMLLGVAVYRAARIPKKKAL
jgi:hypothetical protein